MGVPVGAIVGRGLRRVGKGVDDGVGTGVGGSVGDGRCWDIVGSTEGLKAHLSGQVSRASVRVSEGLSVPGMAPAHHVRGSHRWPCRSHNHPGGAHETKLLRVLLHIHRSPMPIIALISSQGPCKPSPSPFHSTVGLRGFPYRPVHLFIYKKGRTRTARRMAREGEEKERKAKSGKWKSGSLKIGLDYR